MPTIAAIAAGDSDFDILVAAISYIDSELGTSYLTTLSNPDESLTVFAPTNAAFGQLAMDMGFDGDVGDSGAVTAFLVALGAETLETVVLYHLAGGELSAADITMAGEVTTLQGGIIDASNLPSLGDLEPDLADPMLVATDIAADNGVIHVIDKVLLPVDFEGNGPTIADIAAGDASFSILVEAVGFIDTELGTNYLATLANPDASLTVFAPTNMAFGALAADLGFEGDTMDAGAVVGFLVTLGAETLETVVLYHLAAGELMAADVAEAGMVTTLQGGMIDASELPTLGDMEPDLIDPSLVATDIEAENGVIHVIDKVLLPVDFEGNDAPTITGTVLGVSGESGFDDNGGDFDMLREAVVAAGLAETLDDVSQDLTVFAPTDAAFIGLANALGYDGSDEEGAFNHIVASLRLLNGGNDPIELLTTVLTYHVAPTSLQASQVLSMDMIETLQGGNLMVDAMTGMLGDAEPDVGDPSIIATDIQAANGIIHALDGVLLPADLLPSDGSQKVDFVIGSNDGDQLNTGVDNDLVDGQGGDDNIIGGNGDDTILGGDGSDNLRGNRGDDMVKGDAGGDTIRGGVGNDYLDGGAGNDTVHGGRGDDMIMGGAGNDNLRGGPGDDVFVFGTMDGNDTIRGFRDGDMIDLTAFGYTSFSDIQGSISQNGKSTMIDLGDTTIMLTRTDVEDLGADDFMF